MPHDSIVVAPGMALLVLAGACDDAQSLPPLPPEAAPVGSEALIFDELASVADLGVGDQTYRLPVADDRAVLLRLRSGHPPIVLGTSCDVVSAYELPEGWDVVCLGWTAAGAPRRAISLWCRRPRWGVEFPP